VSLKTETYLSGRWFLILRINYIHFEWSWSGRPSLTEDFLGSSRTYSKLEICCPSNQRSRLDYCTVVWAKTLPNAA